MVIGYHIIWTAYGWWLPNDPRGSSSHEIRCAEISGLGELHHGRRKIQPAATDIRRFYEAAQLVLKQELLKFSSDETSRELYFPAVPPGTPAGATAPGSLRAVTRIISSSALIFPCTVWLFFTISRS